MTKKYQRLFMLGLVAISALVFFAIALVGRSSLSSSSQKLVSLKLQNKTANNQLASLAAAKKQVQKYSYFNEVAKSVIPNDKDQAQAVLDIFQMASSSGIALQDVSFPASNLGVKSSASGSDSTSSSSTSPVSQAKPVSGIPGLYSLQLTITPQAGAQVSAGQATTYPKFLDFLSRIERDRRTAQITQVSIEPQTTGSSLSFSLTVNIFIKP